MRRYVFGAVVLILLIATVAFAFRPARAVPQPIAYPHKIHVTDNQMECLSCHVNADRSIAATIPSVTDCMVCHENVKPDSPEIKKLAAYAEKNEEPPWVRVYGFPVEAVAMTRAPRALAICTAKLPTPPEPPWMRIVCPGCNFATSTNACHAVNAPIGTAAASTKLRDLGFRATSHSLTVT